MCLKLTYKEKYLSNKKIPSQKFKSNQAMKKVKNAHLNNNRCLYL